MTFRAFIAVDVIPLSDFTRLQSDLIRTEAPIKMVDLGNLHLTLKFLGETNEDMIENIVKAIEGSIASFGPFRISISGIGVFPNRERVKVIWVGIDGYEPLKRISLDLDHKLDKMGFRSDKRGFKPHLTIGRVKGSGKKKEIFRVLDRWAGYRFGKMDVKSIKLMKSQLTSAGPIYTVIKEAEL